MINWEAFKDPELWTILARIAKNLLHIIGSLCAMCFWLACLWYGVSVGKPGDTFHLYINPLKDLFR